MLGKNRNSLTEKSLQLLKPIHLLLIKLSIVYGCQLIWNWRTAIKRKDTLVQLRWFKCADVLISWSTLLQHLNRTLSDASTKSKNHFLTDTWSMIPSFFDCSTKIRQLSIRPYGSGWLAGKIPLTFRLTMRDQSLRNHFVSTTLSRP